MTIRVFDVETTDLEHREIIEAAYCTIDYTTDVMPMVDFTSAYLFTANELHYEQFAPTHPISLGAMSTHHIVESDLLFCEPSSSFKLPTDTAYLIGHNIDFDWKAAGEPDVKRICTLALSRWLFPDIDSHTLTSMMYYAFGEGIRDRVRGSHNAGVDVVNTAKLLIEFLIPKANAWLQEHKKREIADIERLWEVSEAARIPTVMAFGKHKGVSIKKLPVDYCEWILRQPDIDPYLVAAIKRKLGRA
ncbi:MAG: hypothetical protein BWK73_25515 [Thiothrix lacustris]|uniref:Exonuclease domain-containing protein n=1 Tax=Thiothrix lacustris TaxID=525917 RepID=A0A1Y1QLL5_9GAMM|nr:MAG: hypothetical protein BWK73_25515 [Thiothrix lacustris]